MRNQQNLTNYIFRNKTLGYSIIVKDKNLKMRCRYVTIYYLLPYFGQYYEEWEQKNSHVFDNDVNCICDTLYGLVPFVQP